MKNHKIKFVVVGYGHIGKKHAEVISANSYAELVAIVDNNEQLAKEIKKNKIPFYDSIDKLLLDNLKFDVANICTPNGLHAEHSIKFLENKKHVVCEKPMAITKSQCESIVYKSLQTTKQVFCVKQNRYSPTSVWLKSIIDNKLFGNVYMVQINCYWNRNESYYQKNQWKGTLKLDGGPLFTQFSHFIDIMYWLFGDITDIKAIFGYYKHTNTTEFEDSGFVNFKFINGGLGSINYSTAVHEKNLESSITVIGENGSVKVGGQYMEKVEYCNINNYTMPQLPPANPPNNYGNYKGSASNHQYIIQNVIETLNGNSFATTNALEGLKVVEIIERIYSLRK